MRLALLALRKLKPVCESHRLARGKAVSSVARVGKKEELRLCTRVLPRASSEHPSQDAKAFRPLLSRRHFGSPGNENEQVDS